MSADTNNLWDEARLHQLIADKIEEGFDLEYKAAGALSKDAKIQITKDVSALANSAGGTIIYGLAEYQDTLRKHLAERIDPVDRTAFSKEWLEQVISQIRPRIVDMKIFPVPLSSNANHVAYVVEIAQSSTAHQATDFRYYRRYNFEAVPMQDHEVRDVMNRTKAPRLAIEVTPKLREEGQNSLSFDVEAWLLNQSEGATAHNITVQISTMPDAWNMDYKQWQYIRLADESFKWLLQTALNPGERATIASWKAGPAFAPFAMMVSGGEIKQKPNPHLAQFQEESWEFAFNLFANNQPRMKFICHFSKAEMQLKKPKLFTPLQLS